MFGFLKKKKKGNERGMTIGTYHSGDASIEAMKDEFFKHFNAGESAGMLIGDEHFRKAYDVAKEWTKHEDTNRSYGCLAAAAFKLGASNMDREKLQEAHDIYAMLSEHSSDYKKQLAAVDSILSKTNDLADQLRKMVADGKLQVRKRE